MDDYEARCLSIINRDKPKRGRPALPDSERRRNTINVRFDDATWRDLEKAAAVAGRSLSGEIQRRLVEHEQMRETIVLARAIIDGWEN